MPRTAGTGSRARGRGRGPAALCGHGGTKALPVTQGEAGARTKGEGRVPSRGGTEPNFFLTGPHLLQVENRQGGTCNRPDRDDGHLDQGGRGQGR